MNGHVRAALLAAFRHVFQPLVRLALRNGISYDEFCGSLKRVFVETISADFQIPGHEMTASRIGILAGLPRDDVEEILDEIETGIGDELIILARITKLIEGWTSDGEFTGPYGLPLELRQQEGKGSFPALVKRYGEKMAPQAMLRELKRVGVVQETKDRKIRLLSRSYIAGRFRPEAIDRMGRVLGDLAETLEFNLNPLRPEPARLERQVYTDDGVDLETLKLFRAEAKELGQDFLEKLDNWLSEREIEEERKMEQRLLDPQAREESKVVKVGVGIYLYEHWDNNRELPNNGESGNEGT